MHVMVLGAGVTGVTTAWYLVNAGFDVSVVDRRPDVGLETSYANGGQISISHPEPWSSPSAPLLALRWLGREDAPLRLRLGTDPTRWRWLAAFLRECLPWRHQRNAHAIAALAVHSGACLRALRDTVPLEYAQQTRGIMHLCRDAASLAHARARLPLLTAHGIRARICTVDECVAIEPALGAFADRLAGGLYAADDESGDAAMFTRALAARARDAGVRFVFDTTITRLHRDGERIAGLSVVQPLGGRGALYADAYVICLGSYGPPLLAGIGEHLPIHPVKGYSVTLPVREPARAPQLSLTDESRRIVCSRLGERLRVAGTAEICGFDTSAPANRCRPLLRWVEEVLPGAADLTAPQLWAGLRPATPSNVPVIGAGPCSNLWYNTGHGSLGWTLACGSAHALAELVCGHAPPITGFPFRGSRTDAGRNRQWRSAPPLPAACNP